MPFPGTIFAQRGQAKAIWIAKDPTLQALIDLMHSYDMKNCFEYLGVPYGIIKGYGKSILMISRHIIMNHHDYCTIIGMQWDNRYIHDNYCVCLAHIACSTKGPLFVSKVKFGMLKFNHSRSPSTLSKKGCMPSHSERNIEGCDHAVTSRYRRDVA